MSCDGHLQICRLRPKRRYVSFFFLLVIVRFEHVFIIKQIFIVFLLLFLCRCMYKNGALV